MVGLRRGSGLSPTVNFQSCKVEEVAPTFKLSPITSTALTCFDDPRSIFQKQFMAGPVMNNVFDMIPTFKTGEETRYNEFANERFGITSALSTLLLSSYGTQV